MLERELNMVSQGVASLYKSDVIPPNLFNSPCQVCGTVVKEVVNRANTGLSTKQYRDRECVESYVISVCSLCRSSGKPGYG